MSEHKTSRRTFLRTSAALSATALAGCVARRSFAPAEPIGAAKSALPSSYFWTWDHSTNWVLDDNGMQNEGCFNKYLKRPQTYLEDYRRLTDLAAQLGIKGIVIWGFLRDSHGGIEYAKRVAGYAASKGVAIMPGVGTTWYGGIYYEGDHPYNLAHFLREHPDARMLDEHGQPREYAGQFGASPGHPAYRQWLADGLAWLFREFEIGGVNLENGDLLTDSNPLTQALRASWPPDDPEPFFFQGVSYRQALEAIKDQLPRKLATYATYTGFQYGQSIGNAGAMGARAPAMFERLPPQGVCQWTLTGMLRAKPLPLTAYLDDGAPAEAFDNPNWPTNLRAPSRRGVGFVHHGSQWHGDRYRCVISSIKEACLRAHHAGLEGISIHGEVAARYVPARLNYLAFSHFTRCPNDSMRDFGRMTLAPILGSESKGEMFAEVLCHCHAGSVTDSHRKAVAAADDNDLWRWLRDADRFGFNQLGLETLRL